MIEAGIKSKRGQFGISNIARLVIGEFTSEPEVIAKLIETAMFEHSNHVLVDDYTIMVLRIDPVMIEEA